jgi:thiosulfate reductase/polysulfide reductase chain A
MATFATETTQRPVVCCGCTTQCGLVAQVAAGRVIGVTGDPEHPVSRGYVCPKGKDAPAFAADSRRLLQPLKRQGARGSGRWQEIDWEQALDEIAERISAVTTAHGKRALAYSYGTFRGGDWGIGERFMNRFGSPNSCGQDKICYGPITLAETLTYGVGPTVFTAPVPGVTRCMVVWGMRPSASAPLLWRAIREAQRAGARLIVIDPQRTTEARRADLWLQVQPGGDAAFAVALLKLLVASPALDRAWIAQHTTGFEALEKHLHTQDLAALAGSSGIMVPVLETLATTLLTSGPTVFHAGNGLCQGGRSALQLGRAIACLIALTRNAGIPGGHALGGPPRDLPANGELFDAGLLSDEMRRERLGAEHLPFLGDGYVELDHVLARHWHGRHHLLSWIATAHEPTLWRAIETGLPYPVRALVIQNHNPMGSNPNAAAVNRALRSENLELSVVHDLFMTPTAHLADFVLPAAHWLEKPWFSFGIGFVGAFGDYVGGAHAATSPPGQAMSDYDFWRDLGHRLGQRDVWPATAEMFYDQSLRQTGLSFTALAARRGPVFGTEACAPGNDVPVSPAGYATRDGRIALSSDWLAAWAQAAVPTLLSNGVNRTSEDFPHTLTTGGRRIEAFHQNAQHMPRFRRTHPHPVARLSRATAEALGIAENDWISIETPLGQVRQRALPVDCLAPGIIEADRWWYPEGVVDTADPYGLHATHINYCTSDAEEDCDPVLGTWLLRGIPCRISRAAPPWPHA